ncbi:16S rRNA (guanine(527)-N(7))-methyltransferase RsmG [Paracoccus aerodenitrificans]|uniref:16S rRNA (guanine(527)-N(7))-methyltransferase RsmG n=1 Tax=Paracoccus aerodenitrificans TaxID=3017781 RepID=UPI0022F09BC5|nr:16S rRNA (guanine(527)-N(7))-methyltransferase RsmG [Paracoccus aerodenitrificans]WBU63832.1 16S rRNA (guanine(527)-N(7))-methyltransferase RsmG [Paracoccus aerodenitrificans]
MNVSRETDVLLNEYSTLIKKWNPAINLVAENSLSEIKIRHIADSAQLLDLANPTEGSWTDLGSGGGFPGMVLSILTQPRKLTVTLVESDRRKAAFLRTVRRQLGLRNLRIETCRIEALPPLKSNYLSARALASIDKLLDFTPDQLAVEGELWLLKGKQWRDEVRVAKNKWSFDYDTFESATDSESVVIRLRNVKRND